jgi:hypothetical protein
MGGLKVRKNCESSLGCLTRIKSFADGKQRQSQLFMRARVFAQGVTVAAMMGCLYWQGQQKKDKSEAVKAAD